MGQTLLEVEDLHTQFFTSRGVVRAVDGVSLHIDAGETLGVVGESGCGKTMTALSILRLVPDPGKIVSGRILFRGKDVTKMDDDAIRDFRGNDVSMIFQDPMTSLNPVFKIGWQVGEPLMLHGGKKTDDAIVEATEMLGKVGIPRPKERAGDFPHQFSGGMRQRAMIAMGLTTAPQVLIADEPTTALDVTIQAQILDLLRKVNKEFGTATILITHNLGVVAGMCERVMVMYAGRVVEAGPADDVFAHPKHPYTWSLLRSIPRLDDDSHQPLRPIEGVPPDMLKPPSGCAFHPRCPFRIDRCEKDRPELGAVGPTQLAACWVTQGGTELSDRG